jgi:transmembrane sensor
MHLSNIEKSQLKSRIDTSVSNHIKKIKRLKYGLSLAASLALLITLGYYNIPHETTPSIENFVNTMEEPRNYKNVKLILSKDQNIEINDEDSKIAYSNTGEEVKIGNSKSINQHTPKDKIVVFNTLVVPYGKRSEITLSDGTKIWLNSGSKLVFPATFMGKTREVYIEGEAIFEVTHDKKHPFIVKTDNHEIEVLGTIFNVSSYRDDNSTSTVLKSGSIQLNFKNNASSKTSEHIKITPGTLAFYNKNEKHLHTSKVDVEKYFSWRDGVLILKNDPMKSILKKISRYYNIEIEINDDQLANETFSGRLDIKDNVANVIKVIQETTEFEYTIIENNRLIIN